MVMPISSSHLSTGTSISFPGVDMPALVAPRISIIIINYNYAEFVGSAIASALAQRTPPWEIIVVDDGSTDGSRAVMENYRSRVQLIFQDNGGQRCACNVGFSQASGDLVLFLDSDDVLDPDTLTALADSFPAGVAKVHFRLRLIDRQGRPMGGMIPRQLDRGDVSQTIIDGTMYCSAPGSGNIYRASVLRALFPLPVNAADRHGADFFLIIGCGLLGEVGAIPKALGGYRVHQSADDEQQDLMFGNAAKSGDEYLRVAERTQQCRDWIYERTEGKLSMPATLLDFSMEKRAYAGAALATRSLRERLQSARDYFPVLLRATRARQDFGWWKRAAIIVWALFIVCAPRVIAFRAARYVCNPASRRQLNI